MWELIFLMVILKIPIVYLCLVVWWAIRAEPRPLEGATRVAAELDPRPWTPRSRHPVRPVPSRGGTRGTPGRRYARTARAALGSRSR